MIDLSNLKELLSKRGEKLNLSNATGISTGNISDWFNKNKKAMPSAEALDSIANYFDCSVDYLLGRTNIKEMNKTNQTTIIKMPLYIQRVSAGIGNYIEYSEYPDQYISLEENDIPNVCLNNKDDYCVIVSGDSMEPDYHNGDTLFIHCTQQLETGDIGIFLVDNERLVKKYNRTDNLQSILIPLNNAYDEIPINSYDAIIQGKVVGKISK